MTSDFNYALKHNIHYHLIRYEDIATNPLYYAKKIYDNVQFAYNSHVEKWVRQSTKNVLSPTWNHYSTKRNSTSTAFNWLDHLPLHIIRNIETRCADAMRILGYNRLPDDISQTDTESRSKLLFSDISDDIKSLYVQ